MSLRGAFAARRERDWKIAVMWRGTVLMWRPRPAMAAMLASILAITVFAASPAPALQARALVGWWIAIDDTFPKLWGRKSIAVMEEILQINPDGRVWDRVMTFSAGSPLACLETMVCSDLPLIAEARLRVSGNRLNLIDVAPSQAFLDAGGGDAKIRGVAIAATPEWTVAADGDRITMHSSNPARTRVLVRVAPDRLRKLYAGMKLSALPPAGHWRCFLANATARDKAFAPLRTGTAAAEPGFLGRYLNLASYVSAIRSALATPAIDEDDPELRKLLGVTTEELMVEHFDGVMRPPSIDDRRLLLAVLHYVERHTRALIASRSASTKAAQAKARADDASREAAARDAAARAAAVAARTADAKAKSAAAELGQARAAVEAQAKTAQVAAATASEADAVAAAKHEAGRAAAASLETAARLAKTQQQKAAAMMAAAEQLQTRYERARRAAEQSQRQHQDADRIAKAQRDKSIGLATTAKKLADVAAKAAAKAATKPKNKPAIETAKSDAASSGSNNTTSDKGARTVSPPDRASDPLREARQRAIAARDKALAAAKGAAAEAARLETLARRTGGHAAETLAAAQAAEAAWNKAKVAAEASATQAKELAELADAAADHAREASSAKKTAVAVRDQTKARSEAAAKELARRTQNAQRAEAADAAAQQAAQSAADNDRQAQAAAAVAADHAAKIAAELQAAAKAATAAQAELRAAAASQPQSEGLIAIAKADIAALADVFDPNGEGGALFCRGGAASPASRPAFKTVSIPMPRPRMASVAVNTATRHTGAVATSAASSTRRTVRVPLPVARPAHQN
jgi:hypothetical protein